MRWGGGSRGLSSVDMKTMEGKLVGNNEKRLAWGCGFI